MVHSSHKNLVNIDFRSLHKISDNLVYNMSGHQNEHHFPTSSWTISLISKPQKSKSKNNLTVESRKATERAGITFGF